MSSHSRTYVGGHASASVMTVESPDELFACDMPRNTESAKDILASAFHILSCCYVAKYNSVDDSICSRLATGMLCNL
jgi:hypothetical protein